MNKHALWIIFSLGMMIIGVSTPSLLQAQAPQSISYQTIVRDAAGEPIADQLVSLQMTLHQGNASGTVVYCETHTTTTNPLGLVNLKIGTGTVVSGSFQNIEWSTGQYYLEVELDPAGGTAWVPMGTTQLVSVPYALYSETTGQEYTAGNGIEISNDIITNTAPDQVVSVNSGTGISVSGVYPTFTVSNNSPDQPFTLNSGSGIGVTGTYPNFTISNIAPDQVVTLSNGTGINVTGTYPNFTVTNAAPNVSHTGDATGSEALTVVQIQGRPVSTDAPAAEQVLQWNGLQWIPATISGGGGILGWLLTGNAGTDPAVNFLGTIDNQPLRFKASNLLAGEINPGNGNTFLGRQAGENSTGTQNTATGGQSLHFNTTGNHNTASGHAALYSNGSGSDNTASGYEAMIDNTTGYSNVAIGVRALYHNTSRSNLVAIGDSALYNNGLGATDPWQASRNTAIGSKAMYNNTTGHRNTASGWQALYSSTTGYGNTTSGFQTLYSSTTGSQNVAIGWRAGYYLTAGNDNIFIGSSSGPASSQSIDSSMWLGITSENQPVLYGDLTDGRIGIGTTSPHPSAKLEVNSNNKGFLPPRMTASQRTVIVSPAAGLLVFQTDTPSGYYYYTGANWVGVEGSGAGAISSSSCIDYDGNAYPTFTIGTQVWMAENLRVTHYRNGDAIPNVTNGSAWATLTTGAYCWYNNDQAINAKYGTLYNFYAVDDSRGLCPNGWHVPTDTEWQAFTTYLGGEDFAGGKMKSVSALWNSPNTDATNNSGFSGLPGGHRYYYDGSFYYLGDYGYFWSSSQLDANYAWLRTLSYYYADVGRGNSFKEYGYSVRCLKDQP